MRHASTYIDRSPQVFLIALACFLASANGAVADLNDGLVGYWSFDEGEGSTAYDYSGHGNHGTIYGAQWVTGVAGTALSFDGSDDYVDVPNIDRPTGFSVAIWARLDEWKDTWWGVGPTFINKYRESQQHTALWEDTLFFMGQSAIASGSGPTIDGYKKPAIRWQIGNGTDVIVVHVNAVDKGVELHEWHHYALTYSPIGALIAYLDGEQIGDETASLTGGDEDAAVVMGKWSSPKHELFLPSQLNGLLDEARIYHRALTTAEIADLYWSVRPDPEDDTTEGDQSDVSGTSKDPVNTATGSFFHQETDLSIPSRGLPLTFTRFYNSKSAAPGRKVAKSGQTAAKSKQAPPKHKTATSQPASTNDGKRPSVDAKKRDESPADKDQVQAAGSSQARPKTKEKSK